jgi:hypothetical protein
MLHLRCLDFKHRFDHLVVWGSFWRLAAAKPSVHMGHPSTLMQRKRNRVGVDPLKQVEVRIHCEAHLFRFL